MRVTSEGPALLAEIEIPALLDLLPSGVLVVDTQGRPVQMNVAARRIGPLIDRRHSVDDAAPREALRAADDDQPLARHQTPFTRALRGERVDRKSVV